MPCQAFLSLRRGTRRRSGCSVRGWLRRRGRLPPLFLLRGHLFAVLPHLVTHRFGTYRLATGCLAASCEVPHHLLAVLLHLLNHAALQARPQRHHGADSDHSPEQHHADHHYDPPPRDAVRGLFWWTPFGSVDPLTRTSRRSR